MRSTQSLFSALGLNSRKEIHAFSRETEVSVEKLRHFNDSHVLPVGEDLKAICRAAEMSRMELMLRMGVLDRHLIDELQENAEAVAKALNGKPLGESSKPPLPTPDFTTERGKLYKGDCLEIMPGLPDESVDLVFADPPFNLNKLYPSGIDDDLKEQTYLRWCEDWLEQSVRVLKPGGSLFLWNLPKWNIVLGEYLNGHLTFRHWIAVDIKYTLPIAGRLYPSHYSLLYYVKGDRPSVFHPDRLAMEVCPHCYGDLRDYGGYKHKMNPKGVNLTDVWWDIPPVRHSKYKNREGVNELSIHLMDRIIEMATDPEDVVLDPFGGAGTTYAVAEIKGRNWIGMEVGPIGVIEERLSDVSEEASFLEERRSNYNALFPPDIKAKRIENKLWTSESVRKKKAQGE